jgi:hypothetical protein
MYVFLAMLQQMGLDGCLVGSPGAEQRFAGDVARGMDNAVLTGTPRGPFWAVGVRVGTDVRLYDPWRGRVFPATLGQLKANPDAHRAWFEDKANISGATAAGVKDAVVCLAVPVSALAPRMVTLEEQLKAEIGVRLAVNAAKLREALPDAKFWNPPGDPFAYGRTARLFLPSDVGGIASTGPDSLFAANIRAQLPPPSQLLPPELLASREVLEDVGTRIVGFAQRSYVAAFIHPPPTPRERFQRGQFQDAALILVKRQDLFRNGLERLRNNPNSERQIKEWADVAVKLYAERGRALADRDPGAEARAREKIDEHWTKQSAAQLLVDRAVSTIGLAEATLELAQCKHELAERLQTQLDASAGDAAKLRPEVAAAWAEARHAWASYTQYADAHASFPGRAEHAKALTARAEEMAQKK